MKIKKPYNAINKKKNEELEKKDKSDLIIYGVKYDVVEKNKKKGAKSTRFNPPKVEELQDINPKTTFIKLYQY